MSWTLCFKSTTRGSVNSTLAWPHTALDSFDCSVSRGITSTPSRLPSLDRCRRSGESERDSEGQRSTEAAKRRPKGGQETSERATRLRSRVDLGSLPRIISVFIFYLHLPASLEPAAAVLAMPMASVGAGKQTRSSAEDEGSEAC